MWVAEERGIQLAGYYIATRIEERRAGIDYISWEHFVANQRGFKSRFQTAISLLFVTTEIVAVIIASSISADLRGVISALFVGQFRLQFSSPDTLLAILGAVSVVLTLLILRPRTARITG
jgi:hypothetical protein